MSLRPLRIAVSRFDPAADRDPRWSIYEIAPAGRATVLDALLQIEEQHDPTLAFRRTCRSGICGACAGLVNGRARLFCQSLLVRVVEDRPPARSDVDVVVEPLPGFGVLKDLVVDMTPFFDELAQVKAWLVPDPGYGGRVSPEVARDLWAAAGCVLCGVCHGVRATGDGPHAAAVARVWRLARDPRDSLGPERLRSHPGVSASSELARRLKAVCPVGVDLAPLLETRRSDDARHE